MQLIVLGMHRSGTSVLARMLNLMGAYFGPEGASTGANPENPKGFWERRDVRRLNDFALHSAGHDWNRVAGFDVERIPPTAREEFTRRAAALLLELDAHRPWFLKEPRMCLLLPLWRDLLEAPVGVHILRHPVEVASSLQKRNGIPMEAGMVLWEQYVRSAIAHSNGWANVVVSHRQLMDDPRGEVEQLHRALATAGGRELRIPPRTEIEAFVQPGLYRERQVREDLARYLGAPQVALFNRIMEARELSAAAQVPPADLAPLAAYESTLGPPPEASLPDSDAPGSTVDAMNAQQAVLERLERLVDELARSSTRKESAAVPLAPDASILTYQSRLVRSSGLFDEPWYLAQYPDVAVLEMDALEHFLKIGWRLGRSPGPKFDTRFYLQQSPDVERAGLNPLVHYLEHGRAEQRPAVRHQLSRGDVADAVDIVVPVFNALEHVQSCLASLHRHRADVDLRVLVVNDGSDEETTSWLREFCAAHDMFQLIEHERNLGYTRAVNTGLRESAAPYVVALNSDTIVTRGWLKGLLRCACSDQSIGIVGPLSNAASWQNVPVLRDAAGQYAVNRLPDGMDADAMASLVARVSERSYPRLPFINGFSFLIRRAVISAIGYMDEEAFPVGYGEENDYCIRALEHGFELAVADDVYVHHAKSQSFGSERRQDLSRRGWEAIEAKHGAERFAALVEVASNTTSLDRVRQRICSALELRGSPSTPLPLGSFSVVFLLPVKGGGGGAHSVVQEAVAMRRLGVEALVAVREEHFDAFLGEYGDLADGDVFLAYAPGERMELSRRFDVVVGTAWESIQDVEAVWRSDRAVLPAYYVQDYEPLFFPEGSDEWRSARESYERVPGAVLFAKTHWVREKIHAEHGIKVHKVEPGLDHSTFFPRPRSNGGVTCITAMIRPQTPRRGAERTLRLLGRLSRELGTGVDVHVFGCPGDHRTIKDAAAEFPFTSHGVLTRVQAARLLAAGDLFVDLSDYQAFGRTALEAMACGSAAVVPAHGGASEYAIDGVNSLIVDSFDEDATFERIKGLLANEAELSRMKLEGLRTASGYSVHRAAVSELTLLSAQLAAYRQLEVALSGHGDGS